MRPPLLATPLATLLARRAGDLRLVRQLVVAIELELTWHGELNLRFPGLAISLDVRAELLLLFGWHAGGDDADSPCASATCALLST